MSNSDEDGIRAFFAKTDDPAHRSLQRLVLGWALDAFPEVRRLALTAEEAARVEGCTSLEVLTRWLRQAVVAASVVDALR